VIIITLTVIVLINTAQSIYITPNTYKTDCFGTEAEKYESTFSKINYGQINDDLLKMMTADDKSKQTDAPQLDSQHTGELVGTTADDTQTDTKSYIGD